MKKDEGVSPVIATILMVAITVVLAAVLYVVVSSMMSTSTTTKNIGIICTKIGSTANYKCPIQSADAGVDWSNVGIQVLTQDGTIVGSLAKGFSFDSSGVAPLTNLKPPLDTTAGTSKVVDNGDSQFGVGDEIYLIAASGKSLVGLNVKLSGGGEGSAIIQ
jgi:flagellin-like protein